MSGKRGVSDEAVDEVVSRHGVRWWVLILVAIGFGLLYAYDLFEAIGNLLGVAQLNGLAAEGGLDPIIPWSLPITGVALPPVAYLAAVIIGRRRGLGVRVLLFVVGLAVVAAITLSLTALA